MGKRTAEMMWVGWVGGVWAEDPDALLTGRQRGKPLL